MGVTIPQPFRTRVEGPMGPVTVDGIDIPDHFTIDIESLPKIQLGLDPVTINPLAATLTLQPVDIALRIERLPDIRAHLPADFSVGLSILGLELLCVRLCGEAQMITEPYKPNPCETCGPAERLPDMPPLPTRNA